MQIVLERPRPPNSPRVSYEQMPSSKKNKRFVVPKLSAEERANLPELPTNVWYHITDILIRQRCKVTRVFTLCKATAELAQDTRLFDLRIDAFVHKHMDRVDVLTTMITGEYPPTRDRLVTTVNDALLRIYADPSRRPANASGARYLLKAASGYSWDSTVKILLQLYPPHPGDTAALERAIALGGSPIAGLLKTAYDKALDNAWDRAGSCEVARLLIGAGASLANAGDLLRRAAKRNKLDLVRLLLDTVLAKPFEDRVLQRSDDELFAEDSDYVEDYDEAVSSLPNGAEITAAGLDTYVVRTSRIPSSVDFREAKCGIMSNRVRNLICYYEKLMLPSA